MSFAQPPIPHPGFGSRIFRRRIRLENRDGAVIAGLEDNLHAARLRLRHDGSRILAVEAQWLRQPNRNCGGAIAQLGRLAGQQLTGSRALFRACDDPRRHCTHLHDLLGLAAAHALRPAPTREFDLAVPDPKDGVTVAQIRVDGEPIHRWRTDLLQILGPEEARGGMFLRGFGAWSAARWGGDALEAAAVLQMGIIISGSQRFDLEAMRRLHPDVALVSRERVDTCYAYQAERIDTALPTQGTVRDFTDCPEQLLRFL